MPLVDVTRTYLELTSPDQLRPAPPPSAGLDLEHVRPCPPDLYRFLYHEVGREWNWMDRWDWDDQQILQHVERAEIEVWLLREHGRTAGWFELERRDDGSVEIVYLGLLPGFHGRGLGKYLLTQAADRAWQRGANRVWLHTCTLDSPAALPNYLARGFRPYREQAYRVRVPA